MMEAHGKRWMLRQDVKYFILFLALLVLLSSVIAEDTVTAVIESDAEENPTDLHNAMQTLKERLKESQTDQQRTRSVLNVIQERQDSQERDLQTLKNEISELRDHQKEDRETLAAIQTMVSDNNWGIASLKNDQDQVRQDFETLKVKHQVLNETLLLEDSNKVNKNDVTELPIDDRITLSHMEMEVRRLKTSVRHDRVVLNQLNNILYNRLRLATSNQKQYDNPNKIPSVPPSSFVDPAQNPDSSGDVLKLDTLSSTLEERSNAVGQNIQNILKREQELNVKVDNFHAKFGRYDSELARIYTLFYNLSLQMSNLDNKLLNHEKHRFNSELSDLQGSFVNFTQQLFTLEQMHMRSGSSQNATAQNQRELTQMTVMLENHGSRLASVEGLIQNYKLSMQENYLIFSNYVSKLNESIQEIHRSFATHNSKASNVFRNVDEKLMEYNMRIRHSDDRLARVELKVANGSLQQCQKTNSDLVQNMKLSDFSIEITKMDDKVIEQGSQINRLDTGMSGLYTSLSDHGKTMAELMEQLQTIIQLVPNVKLLQNEVNNLIQHLPQDCGEVGKSLVSRTDGVYLVKPDNAVRSTRAYCEFDDESDWTVVQRRMDGTVTFARSWQDYKFGFGDPESEYWIGNENLHQLTNQRDYMLRIDIWDVHNEYMYAEYAVFKIGDESSHYRLHVDGYHGNATDALRYSNFMPFSTMDRDNDVSSTHCAKFYTSGWWYKHCHYCNLNGRYTVGVVWFNHDSDEWMQLQRTVMKLRPITSNNTLTTPSNLIV